MMRKSEVLSRLEKAVERRTGRSIDEIRNEHPSKKAYLIFRERQEAAAKKDLVYLSDGTYTDVSINYSKKQVEDSTNASRLVGH